jgi:hypothetical protein
MAWRHKKAGVAEHRELWTAALLSRGKSAGIYEASLPAKTTRIEPALPPLPKARLSCRQLGYYRGRKIFESTLSLLYLH